MSPHYSERSVRTPATPEVASASLSFVIALAMAALDTMSQHDTIYSLFMTDWNIQSRAHACEACGRGFHDKEQYHTLLFDEKAAFRRMDICDACWQKQFSDGARDR